LVSASRERRWGAKGVMSQNRLFKNNLLLSLPSFVITIERLGMMLHQTGNGKNETFSICVQLSVLYNENIHICGE